MTMRVIAAFIASFMLSSAAWAEGDVAFTLTNASGQAVTGFYAGLTSEADPNLLAGSLEPTSSTEVMIPAGQEVCVRNLRIVFSDGTVHERPEVDLCNVDEYSVE